jgi:hypothetical protein
MGNGGARSDVSAMLGLLGIAAAFAATIAMPRRERCTGAPRSKQRSIPQLEVLRESGDLRVAP